jgi:hypothetical protein
MPTIDNDTIERIIRKFGSNIDLTAKPGVIEEIIREVSERGGYSASDAGPGLHLTSNHYNRSYTQGGWYGRTYSQYDRTVDEIVAKESPVYKEVEKLMDRVFLDKLRNEYAGVSSGVEREKGKS